MTETILSMAGGRVLPSEWLHTSDPVIRDRWQQLETRPGLYALLADWVVERELRPWEVSALLKLSLQDQLIQMRLPKLPGLAGLLDRLRFVELSTTDIQRFRFWLQGISEIPRRLLHMPEVQFEYLEAVMHEPLLALLPPLDELGVDACGHEAIARLGQLVRQYWSQSKEMGCTEKGVSTRLGQVRSNEKLDELVRATALNYWRYCMRRDQVQVPLPLLPRGNIRAPRTLTQFERLGALQKHCVAQYFSRALKGECAIYCVRDGSRIALTVELERNDDGLWYPQQVLATRNTLPFTRHVRELLHWLALSQVTGEESRSYYRNLLNLMSWASEGVIHGADDEPWTDHWIVLTNVLAGLIHERVNVGYAEQVSLPLDKGESPLELEKMRRRERSKRQFKSA